MLILLQLALFCFLFIFMVKCAARDSGINCLYFYPKEYIAEALKRGVITDEGTLMKKRKQFMIPFCIILLIVLILMISVWNRVTDFKTAYLQSLLFLIVMNWFDGIVIDRLWVGHGKIWVIEGMKGVPYVKPWKEVLIKRGLGTILYLVIALGVAGLVVLAGHIWL